MEEECIEIPIIPEPLSEVSRALLSVVCERWHVVTSAPTCFVFRNKTCSTFECTITIIGCGDAKTVSFQMSGHPNVRSDQPQDISLFSEGASVLAFIASL